jgi:hypothetical protein
MQMAGVKGSVDEKLPYLLLNAERRMPEPEILLLLGGNGAREKAIEWLKTEAARIVSKKIYVRNLNDFPQWVRREFVNGK